MKRFFLYLRAMSDLVIENFKVPPEYRKLLVDICDKRATVKKVKKVDVYIDLLEKEAKRLKIPLPEKKS